MTTRPLAIRPWHSVVFFAALLAAPSGCGGQTSGPPSASRGSGVVTLVTSVPVSGNPNGASYKVVASFEAAAEKCATTKIGACEVNPCAAPAAGVSAANAGSIIVGGADMKAIALEPASDGSYASDAVTNQLPWKTSGETVMFQWQSLPGGGSGDRLTQATPPYVALSDASVFASATSTLSTANDVVLAWSNDTAPSPGDLVTADVTMGSTEVACSFDASAGTGAIPGAALQALGTGTASYDVHAKTMTIKHVVDQDGTPWTLSFNVDTHARTTYGVATGHVAIQ